ncbi:MAG TPA: hypothetical protein VHE37_00200 [Nevskiaceae bacterium]|nr:hypothetical protein [Nevskiaceae bacterium]
MTSATWTDTFIRDYTVPLWLMKLGALLNFYFMLTTPSIFLAGVDPWLVGSAQFVFAASAYRCLFPVHYEHDVVFHDSAFSSIFVTRTLATIKEIAFIYLMSLVLRELNTAHIAWIDALSWLMVVLVMVAECFVWGAVLLYRFRYYVYEESTWLFIAIANTIASIVLWQQGTEPMSGRGLLLGFNFAFAVSYLPFQLLNLRFLWLNADRNPPPAAGGRPLSARLAEGMWRSIRTKNRRTDPESWGGWLGLLWMIGYFATFVPAWMYCIARVLTKTG